MKNLDIIACFDMASVHDNCDISSFIVPITNVEPQQLEDLDKFTIMCNDDIPGHTLFNCFGIFDKHMNCLFKDDTFSEQDYIKVFDVSTFYDGVR